MKNAVLILNSSKNNLFDHLISKISFSYSLKVYYLDQFSYFLKSKIIEEINNFINYSKVELVFFQGDYIDIVDVQFIKKIKVEKKILFLTDDFDTHEVNCINGYYCDLVLSTCPLSVLRYKEKKINSYFLPLESNDKIFYDHAIKKDVDVLFFGKIKADRNNYIEKLKKINIKFEVIGDNEKNFLNTRDLSKIISKSKIIVNFSQSGQKNKFYSHATLPFSFYSMKGRPLMAGLCNTLCISEYSPAIELLFKKQVPFFYTPEEMVNLIKFYLSNPDMLKKKTTEFYQNSKKFSDSEYFPKIVSIIENLKTTKKNAYRIPLWYRYIYWKKFIQIFFRKIKKKFYYEKNIK